MKGIVFSEFIEMVEDVFSPELMDQIFDETDLDSGGAYTAVSTYNYEEMVSLVVKLSEHTNIAVPDLLKTFGKHLMGRFATLYPAFFENVNDCFGFLQTIENHVHVEVRKLYSDTELPTFETEMPNDNSLVMTYSSFRPFADLAEGLINGAIEHFGEKIELTREDLSNGVGNNERFILKRI
jgi:hypothetical protein